ncbi:hypothetical protein TELCIR_04988 [Teladorsagia circumcincta]|uniref:Uncharacterized protein n=1 Tax=Teladorsagia circumcincta TaxID=45464 RepID=A0A2G9US53_TELCI|nr:hypothetical protein TELCIR_04988 [Teladorsagia circumcincta]
MFHRSTRDSIAEAYACGRLADVLRKQHSFREGIYHATRHDCKSYGYFTLASQYYFRAKYHLLESDSFEVPIWSHFLEKTIWLLIRK